MRRCIQLAKNGLGTTAPNPMVGCVIVHQGKIIGEGFTSPYGGPHAEVNAINSVKEPSLLKNSQLYVSLEPCSHFGKTPPCSDLIISKKIPMVIIGIVDSHSKVAGKGIEKMKHEGINVITGILQEECYQINKRFFTFHNKKRPYVILKWAQTKDGFLAPLHKDVNSPFWISNQYSRQLTHKWRSEEMAILVGGKTIIDDNPSLTTRDYYGKNPIRIIFKNSQHLSKKFKIFENADETIFVEKLVDGTNEDQIQHLLQSINKEEIISIIVEGGLKTLNLFLNSGVWDEARIFVGNSFLDKGLPAPELELPTYKMEKILNDQLYVLTNND